MRLQVLLYFPHVFQSTLFYYMCHILSHPQSLRDEHNLRPFRAGRYFSLLNHSWKLFTEKKQPGRFCCSRSCYLPINGVRKPFCLLAGKQRDVETSSLFTASLCGCCCCLCSAVFSLVLFAPVPCIQMWGRATNVPILGKKRDSVHVEFVAVVRPRLAASMCIFILRLLWVFFFCFFLLLIQEHTLVSRTHALIPAHKSHSVSRAHTSKHPHVQDAAHTHVRTHTNTHTLCSPLLWLSAGLGILMSPALFVNAAN